MRFRVLVEQNWEIVGEARGIVCQGREIGGVGAEILGGGSARVIHWSDRVRSAANRVVRRSDRVTQGPARAESSGYSTSRRWSGILSGRQWMLTARKRSLIGQPSIVRAG